MAAQHDALGAVVRAVVAVFGGGDVGDKPGRGAETQGGRRGGLERDGVGIVLGDMDDAHRAVDEDAAGLVVEAVGDEALDFAEPLGVVGHLVVDEDGFLNMKVGGVAGFARRPLGPGRGRFVGSGVGSFSRRSWVCGTGGVGFFCLVGVEHQLKLGRIDALAAFVEQPGEHEVDLLAQELVLKQRPFQLRTQPRDLGAGLLFMTGCHLLQT